MLHIPSIHTAATHADQTSHYQKLNAPTEKAWQAIRELGRLDVWFLIINTNHMDNRF